MSTYNNSSSSSSKGRTNKELAMEPSYLLGGRAYGGVLEGHSKLFEKRLFWAYSFFHFANFVLATAILACALQYQRDYRKKVSEDQKKMYDNMSIVWGFACPLMIYSLVDVSSARLLILAYKGFRQFIMALEMYGVRQRMKPNRKKRNARGYLFQVSVSAFFACFWLGFAFYVGFNGWRRKANVKDKTGSGRDDDFSIECNEKTNPYCKYIKGVGYALIAGIFPQVLTFTLGYYIWSTVKSRRKRMGMGGGDDGEYEEGDSGDDMGEEDAQMGPCRSPSRGRQPRRPSPRRPPTPVRRPTPQRSARSRSPSRGRPSARRYDDDDRYGNNYGNGRSRSPARRSPSRRPQYVDVDDDDDDYYTEGYEDDPRPPRGRYRQR